MNNTQVKAIKALEAAIRDIGDSKLYSAKGNVKLADIYIDSLIYDKEIA